MISVTHGVRVVYEGEVYLRPVGRGLVLCEPDLHDGPHLDQVIQEMVLGPDFEHSDWKGRMRIRIEVL